MEEDQDTIEDIGSLEQQAEKQSSVEHIRPWQFKPGQSGNPGGRPPGPSLKTWVKNRLASMSEEERMDFLKGMNKDIIWRMGEGNPDTKNDITTNGESITITPEALALAKEYEDKLKKGL